MGPIVNGWSWLKGHLFNTNIPPQAHQVTIEGTPPDSLPSVPLIGSPSSILNKQLQELKEIQAKIGLQNPDTSVGIQQAVMIANLLIGQDKKFRFDQISQVIQLLQGKDSYSQVAKNMLLQLSKCSQVEIEEFFYQICLPSGELQSSTEDAIRATLGFFDPEKPLTEAHVARCALAYLICNPRQEQSGSCFASCLQILRSRIDVMKTLPDIKSIVEKGKLFRVVEEEQMIYPSTPFLDSGTLWNQVTLNSSGNLVNSDVSINEAPGIIAALQAMNISNTPENLTKVMLQFTLEDGQVTVSADDIIQAYATTNKVENYDVLLNRGRIAYSRYAICPIQMYMLTAIAGMGYKHGPLITNLVRSIQQVVLEGIEKNREIKNALEKSIRTKCQNLWEIRSNQVDQETPDYRVGRFQLYYKEEDSYALQRVANRSDYQMIIFNLLEYVASNLSGKNQAIFNAQIMKLQQNPTDTIDKLIAAFVATYYETNTDLEQHLPWSNLTSKFLKSISSEFFGAPEDNSNPSIKSPKNADDLVYWLLALTQQAREQMGTKNVNPWNGELINGDIGHAYVWTLHSETFEEISAMSANMGSMEAVYDLIKLPGMEIGNQPISFQLKLQIVENLTKEVMQQLSLPSIHTSDCMRSFLNESHRWAAKLIQSLTKEIRSKIQEKEEEMSINPSTYHTFSAEIYSLFTEISSLLESFTEKIPEKMVPFVKAAIANFIDKAVRETLNESELQKLIQPIVRAADSNWVIGNQNVLFGFGWSVTLASTTLLGITDNTALILEYFPTEGVFFGVSNHLNASLLPTPPQFIENGDDISGYLVHGEPEMQTASV